MNKKKIISQLASVTLLTSTLIATAGTVNPDLVSVRGWADGNEVLDAKITGEIKLSDKNSNQFNHKDTWKINVSTNHKVSDGDIIRFKSKNLEVYRLNDKEIKLKDGTVIGKIVVEPKNDSSIGFSTGTLEFNKKYYLYDATETYSIDYRNSALFTNSFDDLNEAHQNLNPSDELITDFKIVFNKKAEEFNSLDFYFGLENEISAVIASKNDRTVSYSIESNNKQIIKNQYNAKGLQQITDNENNNFIENLKDDYFSEKVIENNNLTLERTHLSFRINSNKKRPLQNGDKIILKSKSDSNFKFDTKALSGLSGHGFAHGLDLNDQNSMVNKNGAYIAKINYYGVHYDKVSTDEIVMTFRSYDERNDYFHYDKNHNHEEIADFFIPIVLGNVKDQDIKDNLISGLKMYVSTETSNSNSKIDNFELDASIPIVSYISSGINTENKKINFKSKITQWVESGSNEILKPSTVNEDFSPAGTIEGYEFVRTDTNTDTNTQTHVFRKIKAEPVKELKTISKDENGLVIKTEKGSGSPTDLSGYKFLEETTDKDGNKVRTYHKIVTKAVATVNGKEVVLNVKDGIVPIEKIDGYSFSERKVDPKTGDVIYLFKKDGDNSNNRTNTGNSNSGASAAGSNNETDVPNSNNGTSKESSNSGTGSENKPLPVVMKDESGNAIKSGLDASTSKEIPGYKLIKEEKDKAGNVVYTYHKIVTKLVALENGKEVVLKDKVGDLTKEDLPGYKFEKEEKSENGDTRFIYSKVSNNNDSSKKTIYKDDSGNVIKQETGVGSNETILGYKIIGEKIDENGNKIVTYHKIVTKSKSTIDGKEVTLLVKDGLDSNPASIPGFAYSETKTDPETGDLIYYYTDRTPNIGGKLAVYKDEQGNVFLTAKGETPEVDEKLYKLLKTETDEDGNQVFTYHRIVTNYTSVIDGKEDVIKTNLGETPKEEIPGYKFDKTEKDDKTGDLKQVYTKDLKTADKKEAVKTGASASKIVARDQNYYEVNGKKYYYYDGGEQWNNENSALYAQDLNKLNDGHKNLKPDTQMITDFEIVFNKKAEEFNTLDFSIGLTNKRSATILSSKDREVVYSIESGGKTIARNSFQMNGDPAYDQAGFNVTNVETLNEVTNTDKGLGNGSLFFNIDPSTSEPLKKGDRIVMESKSDSNFKFDTETNWLKVGKEITLSHGRSEGKGDSLINDHGVFITKLNYLKVKAVEVTPDKVVLEVMNDTYTENANIGAPIKITSFEGYNKEQNKITGMKYYISTETKDPKTTKSASAPTTIQVKGTTVGGSGVRIQYKTTQWVDEATKKAIKNSKIAETVEPAGTIDGYTFVRTDTDSKTGSVTHVFKKNQVKKVEDDVKVTTKWIDEATKESLSKVVIGDKPVEPGTIKGYTFVRTEHPTETEYVHVFKKNEEPKKVVTRFVDEGGNLIKENQVQLKKKKFQITLI